MVLVVIKILSLLILISLTDDGSIEASPSSHWWRSVPQLVDETHLLLLDGCTYRGAGISLNMVFYDHIMFIVFFFSVGIFVCLFWFVCSLLVRIFFPPVFYTFVETGSSPLILAILAVLQAICLIFSFKFLLGTDSIPLSFLRITD